MDYIILISSLVQISLDPFYRTIKGFAVLFEKDWVGYGFQFAKRSNNQVYHLKHDMKDKRQDEEESPLFILFLDCLHQFINQFPCSFEYDTKLLAFLSEEYQSNKYGTFLYDSDQERATDKTQTHTVSIWSEVFENQNSFLNPYYKMNQTKPNLFINFSLFKLRVWQEYFFKYDVKQILPNDSYNRYEERRKLTETYKDLNNKVKSLSGFLLKLKSNLNLSSEQLTSKLKESTLKELNELKGKAVKEN